MPARTAAEVMRGVVDAYFRGDQDSVDAAFASNLRMALPGSGPLAGEYLGLDKARALRERLRERYDPDSIRVTDISPVTDEVARCDVEFAARWDDVTFPVRVSQWFRLDGRGKIREVTLEPADPDAWDRFLGETG